MSNTLKEIENQIRGEVKAQVAAQVVDAMRKADEDGAKKLRDSKTSAEDFVLSMRDRAALGQRLTGTATPALKQKNAAAYLMGQARELQALGGQRAKIIMPTAEELEIEKRAPPMASTTVGEGADLITAERRNDLIDFLRAKTVVFELGAIDLQFTGILDMGYQNSDATFAYANEAVIVNAQSLLTAKLQMTERNVSAHVAVTNNLLNNKSAGVEQWISASLTEGLARARDLVALRSTVAGPSPKGVLGWTKAANKFAAGVANTTGTKIADLVKSIRLVSESNKSLEAGGFAMSPRSYYSLLATLDANSNFVFANQLAAGKLFGYNVRDTTQIPNNLGAGTESEIYFGAWNTLAVGFGLQNPMQLEFFPNGTYTVAGTAISGISNNSSVLRCQESNDVVQLYDNTFAIIQAVPWI
jgi:HK97 family phage major capsid protein